MKASLLLLLLACGSPCEVSAGPKPDSGCPRIVTLAVEDLNRIKLECKEWHLEYFVDGAGVHEFYWCSDWLE